MKRLLTICATAILVLTVSDITWADTHYVDPAGSNTSPYNTLGTAAYSIQDAIDAATDGDDVSVAMGTYLGDIQIDKALTVKSTDGAEETIVEGVGSNDYYLVRVYHCDVTFDGFTVQHPTFEGSSDISGILVGAYLGESVSNVHILNNIVKEIRSESGTPSTYGATGINIGRGPLSNVVISGNTIENIKNPEGGASDHTCGINIWDGADDIVISNNTISDIKYNGVLLECASNVRIENNAITECEVGVRADPFEGVTVSDVTVKYNSISGNSTYGVYNGAGTLDATKNWWGSPTGPCRQLPNGKWVGKGDKVSSNVDYIPWLPWMP